MSGALTGPIRWGAPASFGDASYDYTAWYQDVKLAGGAPTTWPFSSGMYSQYFGKPAARYDAATYARGVNTGAIETNNPTQSSGPASSQNVYVLADQSAWAGAPQTMNVLDRLLNGTFTAGDNAADSLGLPSLASIENLLKTAGKDVLLLAVVVGGVWYIVNRRK